MNCANCNMTENRENYSGPYTGPFAEFTGEPELWGDNMSGVEYEDSLRRDRFSREIEDWE